MTSFKEFLASQEGRLRAEQAQQVRFRDGWTRAVSALIAQMIDWLQDSDPDHLIKLDHQTVELSEAPWGEYRVESLDIWVGNRGVRVVPVAAEIFGPLRKPGDGRWSGRVDLIGPLDQYGLYRFTTIDDTEQWYLRNPRTYELSLLSRVGFDSALVDLFS